MTDEEIALLRAVCEHPDDDLPRLIYADWLDDRGDPRGEFIRIECELAKLAPDDPRRRPLHERNCAIIRDHKDRWVGPIRELSQGTYSSEVKYWDFRRGLLEVLDVQAAVLVGPAADYVRWMPIRQLTVRQIEARQADALAHCLPLRRAKVLELAGGPEVHTTARIPAKVLQTILAGMGDAGPESLTVRGVIGDAGMGVLAGWPGLARVRVLNLQGNAIGNAGARTLASCTALRDVRRLDLLNNPLSQVVIDALLGRFGVRVVFTPPDDQPRRRRRVRR